MTVDVEVGGRAFRVSLTRVGTADAADAVRVVLQPLDDPDAADTRTMHVEPRAHGLTLIDTSDDRVIDAAVLARPHGHWLVQLPGVDLSATIDGRRRREPGGTAASGEQRITAPMPGRVLRLLVAVGDTVAAGQAVVVIEAMKMENALTAEAAGVVREIAVEEGMSVEAGRLLLRIE